MTRYKAGVVSLTLVISLACACTGPGGPLPVATPAAAGAPITLAWGESARLDDAGLDITFDSIFSDGRCPTNITCSATNPVNVTLKVGYTGKGVTSNLNLSAHTDVDGNVDPSAPGVLISDRYGPVQVTLQSVTPYPDFQQPTATEDYRVTLLVVPLEPEPDGPVPPAVSQPFELSPGDTVRIKDADLQVRLHSVRDTRCPLDMDCGPGHGGNVRVSLDLESASGDTERTVLEVRTDLTGQVLQPPGSDAPTLTVAGYEVDLRRITPYPDSNRKITQGEYVVTVEVNGVGVGSGNPSTPPTSIDLLAEQTTIQYGEEHTFETGDLTVTFSDVKRDSRCPLDVNCAWSGIVDVQLIADSPDAPAATFVVGGTTDSQGNVLGPIVEASGPTAWWYDGFTIDLLQVLPYPAQHIDLPSPDEYSVTVSVRAAAP